MPLRKEVFVERPNDVNLNDLSKLGLTAVMLRQEGLDASVVKGFRALGLRIGIILDAVPRNGMCPAQPYEAVGLANALSLKPETIWLDHLRFPGAWENSGMTFENTHDDCDYCGGRDRVEVINQRAAAIKSTVGDVAELGYLAVPFGIRHTKHIALSGQNHPTLAPMFDVIAPMLYHRLLGEPTSHIASYVAQLAAHVDTDVMPVIQVKDMPDGLPDLLNLPALLEASVFASRKPSTGVAWFCWEHVVEKDKLSLLKRAISSI